MKKSEDSFKDWSSQLRALTLYGQGEDDWFKQLEVGDYVVVIWHETNSMRVNHIYEVRGFQSPFVYVTIDSLGSSTNGRVPSTLRPANTHEIALYKQHGRPVDISSHPTEDNASTGLSAGLNEKDELLKEARRRYPKGTKFRSTVNNTYTGTSMGNFRIIFGKVQCEIEERGWLIVKSGDKWAEVIEEAKEKTDVNKCIDGFDNDLFRAITGGGYLSKRGIGDFSGTFETKILPNNCWTEVLRDNGRDEYGLSRDENGDVMYWEPPESDNSIHVVSSRPSVIPFKEDKHIEINILKRNINI